MDVEGQRRTTNGNERRRWKTKGDEGRRRTTKDDERRQRTRKGVEGHAHTRSRRHARTQVAEVDSDDELIGALRKKKKKTAKVRCRYWSKDYARKQQDRTWQMDSV